jgi:hypothetical protein
LREWDYKGGKNDEEKHNIEKQEVILESPLGNGEAVSNPKTEVEPVTVI